MERIAEYGLREQSKLRQLQVSMCLIKVTNFINPLEQKAYMLGKKLFFGTN